MSTPDPREAAVAGLALFPPSLRISALESKSFRDDVGLSVDAIIQLDEIGTARFDFVGALGEQVRGQRLAGHDPVGARMGLHGPDGGHHHGGIRHQA